MKWTALIVLLFAGVLSAQAPVKQSAAPGRRPPKEYTIAQFLDTTAIQGASFSADESKILFSSNKTGIWNAYTVSTSGGAWTPITKSTTDSTYASRSFRTTIGFSSHAIAAATS